MVFYIEQLRFFATLAVILLHSVAIYSDRFNSLNMDDWLIAVLLNSFTRFCVPIFIMISGALNLDNDRPFNFVKRTSQIVLPFIAWSLIYLIWLITIDPNYSFSLVDIFQKEIYYHLWFVYVIIGLYLLTPFLRKITADKEKTKYFLVIWLIWSVIVPFISHFVPLKLSLNLDLFSGYIGLYLLGLYLHKFFDKRLNGVLLYIAYILGVITTFVGIWVWSANAGTLDLLFFSNSSLGVVTMSVGVFLFFKNYLNIENKTFRSLNQYGFQVYLAHPLILDFIEIYVFPSLNITQYNLVLVSLGLFVVVALCTYLLVNIIGFVSAQASDRINLKYFILITSLVGFYLYYMPSSKNIIGDYTKISSDYISKYTLPIAGTQEISIANGLSVNGYLANSRNVLIKDINLKTTRIAMPANILASYSPTDKCVYLVPDNSSIQDSVKYQYFSQVVDLSIYDVTSSDIYGQLVCSGVENIELKLLRLDRLYIFNVGNSSVF